MSSELPPSNALVALLRAIQLDTCDRAAAEIERLQRELADRPALLDGLSIQQWKEHAKAGWKMYAARAENEPVPALSRCPFCDRPADDKGGIWHEPNCEGLQDAGLNKLQHHMLMARAAQPPGAWRSGRPPNNGDSYIVANDKGQVALYVRGIIYNNVSTPWDWNYGEAIVAWQPLPTYSTATKEGEHG